MKRPGLPKSRGQWLCDVCGWDGFALDKCALGRKPKRCGHSQYFGSQGEMKRWRELQMLERSGHISRLQRQVRFELSLNGKHIGYITWDAVFVEGNTAVIEEYKGHPSRDYPIRKALFEALYPGYELREVKAR